MESKVDATAVECRMVVIRGWGEYEGGGMGQETLIRRYTGTVRSKESAVLVYNRVTIDNVLYISKN